MLIEKMHGIAHSFIGKAIFALIPVSFLIGGMSGYLYSSNDSFAAKVNGETTKNLKRVHNKKVRVS